MDNSTKVKQEKYSLLLPGILLLIPSIYLWVSIGITYFVSEWYLINIYSKFSVFSHFLFGVITPTVASVLLFVFDHHLSMAKNISNSLHRLTDVLLVTSNLSTLIGIAFFIYRCCNG